VTSLKDYSGQWTGWNHGPNAGIVIIDLDRIRDLVKGHFYLFEASGDSAGTFGEIEFQNGQLPGFMEVVVRPFHGLFGRELTLDEFQSAFPGFDFPLRTRIVFEPTGDDIRTTWVSSIGTTGSATLSKGNNRTESDIPPYRDIYDWESFKAQIGRWDHGTFVFRGQSCAWPLRTAFHRSSRSDLIPFVHRDIPDLYNHLSGQLKHLYDLGNPIMNASLWALAQHHGYPTPLLDWTHSPYVAAYFAYRDLSLKQTSGSVRIFVLKKSRWALGANPAFVTHSKPLLCLIEPFSLENARALPQQSLMMISNLDDIEQFIRSEDARLNDASLWAIDLPVSQRAQVLAELRLMGIGAGSMFPGIDGTCREFKERYFPDS